MPPLFPAPYTRHQVVSAAAVSPRGGMSSFFSSHERNGDWTMPRLFRIACVMGSVEVDLREARIPEGTSEIEVFAMMGSVEICVPSGVRVEMMADTFAGSIELVADPTIDPDPGAPIITITGSLYLASLEVFQRLAGEEPRDAKKRIKAARAQASRAIGR